tara:strand:- start:381 stop:677 length:297 start_codon:yes stop_codon:yes gene_type:complete
MKAGAGDAFRNYLRFNEVWKKLKSDLGVVPYSFRHSYSKRAHQIYKLSDTEVGIESGASFGGNFYVDSLSTNDGPAPTYLKLLRHNVQLIVDGLTSSS